MSDSVETPETDSAGDPLQVTDAARSKIAELIQEADSDIAAVRVFVSGGGCSGMNYGMTFADAADDRDHVLDGSGAFRVYIDPVALGYMDGAEIDYKDDGVNATFVLAAVVPAVAVVAPCID